MPSKTKQTQMRLGPEALGHLDAIAAHFGLPCRAAAARMAARKLALEIQAPGKSPKKTRRGIDG